MGKTHWEPQNPFQELKINVFCFFFLAKVKSVSTFFSTSFLNWVMKSESALGFLLSNYPLKIYLTIWTLKKCYVG